MPDTNNVDTAPAKEEMHDFSSSLECDSCDESNSRRNVNCEYLQTLAKVYTSSSISDGDGVDHLEQNSVAKPDGETLDKPTDFCSDKMITEPTETTDFFKHGIHHVVKDICIDETASALEKILEADNGNKDKPFSYNPFTEDGNDMNLKLPYDDVEDSTYQNLSSENGYLLSVLQEEDSDKLSGDVKLEPYNPFLFNPFVTDGYDIGEEKTHNELLDSHGLISSSINGGSVLVGYDNDVKETCRSQSLEVIAESGAELGTEDKAVNVLSSEKATKEMMPRKNIGTNHIQENMSSLNRSDHQMRCNGSLNEKDQRNMENEESSDGRPASNSIVSSMQELEEDAATVNDGELKAQSGVISNNFHCEDGPLRGTDESEKNTDGLPLGQIPSSKVLKEVTNEDQAAASARSQFLHQSLVDSNLSCPASLSGRITFSGRIAYSGSISLRSDSSTTSARSFAFPILQSEWSSSPVKMAKADRRHLRKHRGWRMRLMCCRF